MEKKDIEKAAQQYAHNHFNMHETNNYKALVQGFEAGARLKIVQLQQLESELTQLKAENERLKADNDYWKLRCQLAEDCLEKSPCDPDITNEQIQAWNEYHTFIKNFGIKLITNP